MRRCSILCMLLCVCIVLCGCRNPEDNSSVSGEQEHSADSSYTLHLLYNETDSLNPYAVTTKENQELCYLLYDPLVTLNSSFEPIYKLAQSVNLEGKTCTVKLKSALFSDGTRLTAEDVIYSMNLAVNSATRYAAQLKTVKSKSAVANDTVVIELTKADPFFVNLLDFPIIKSGSENLKSEDNITLPPVGAGRYIINGNTLAVNPNYYGGDVAIKKIELKNAPGSESINHFVSAGVVSVCYSDYSDNTVPRMSGLKVSVPLNNMVYVGINMSHHLLKDPYLRYAISAAVNRSEIVSEAYYGNGTPATGPFNPVWRQADGFQTLQNTSNTQISVVNLEKIGYNSIDSEGYRVNYANKRIKLSLLVNSDNPARLAGGRLLAEQLAAVGIQVDLVAVDYATYLSRLQSGSFDLYLGEVKLTCNMDLSELVTPGGSAAYGIVKTEIPADTGIDGAESASSDNSSGADQADASGINLTSADAVKGYYEGSYTLGDVATAFLSEMPLIPIMYRGGIAMFTPDIESAPEVSVSDLYIDINNYSFNN